MEKENFEIYDENIFELKTRVKSVRESDGFLEVILEKTPFRPSSGGQPSDNGFLENDNFKGFVVEVLDKKELVHRLKVEFGILRENENVIARINIERRNKLKIMHSGEHLFFGVLKMLLEEKSSFLDAEKINLEEDEGSLFVKTEKLDFELLFKAEDITNELIEKGVDVLIHYSDKEKVRDFLNKGLRIKAERIEENFVRILEFKGVDISACTGTHVKNTKEIKAFLVTDFKKLGDERFIIKFKTGENAKKSLVLQSKILRLLKDYSGKNEQEIFDFFKKQVLDKERFKEKYYNYFSEFIQKINFERIKKIEFCFFVFEDEDLKLLIKNASKLCTEKRLICFLNRIIDDKFSETSKNQNTYDVVAMGSNDLPFNLKEIFENEIIKECPGKIGGNQNYVVGRIICNDTDFLKNFLKRKL